MTRALLTALTLYATLNWTSMVDATVSISDACPGYVVIYDFYYCPSRNIYCLQCPKHTFYRGPCTENTGGSDCGLCPNASWNPKPFHLDNVCEKNSGPKVTVAVGFASAVSVDDVCPDHVALRDLYYCPQKNLYCLQCTEHTYYRGPCIENSGFSDCENCPDGTWNPKPYHVDNKCYFIPKPKQPETTSRPTPSSGAYFKCISFLLIVHLFSFFFLEVIILYHQQW